MDKSQLNFIENWLRTRKHSERIVFLLLGWLVIFLIWYVFFALPLVNERADVIQQTKLVNNEYIQTQTQIETFQKKIAKATALKKEKIKSDLTKQRTNIIKVSNESADRLIRQFFNLDTGIKGITLQSASLKNENSNAIDYSFVIQFTAGYFETLSYLGRLENLPWCLAWDSLTYTVIEYPDAAISVKLHTLNDV